MFYVFFYAEKWWKLNFFVVGFDAENAGLSRHVDVGLYYKIVRLVDKADSLLMKLIHRFTFIFTESEVLLGGDRTHLLDSFVIDRISFFVVIYRQSIFLSLSDAD